MSPVVPPPESATELGWLRPLEWLMSAAGGALVALVAFRTKIHLMDREIRSNKATADKEIQDLQKDILEAIALFRETVREHRNDVTVETARAERATRDELSGLRTEVAKRHEENRRDLSVLRRQQLMTLQIVADLARASGTDKRLSDTVIRMLGDVDANRDES